MHESGSQPQGTTTPWPLRGLYAIVDVEALTARKLEPVRYANALLTASPAALQLRAKELPARECLALLRPIAAACRSAGVACFANDRPDLALLAGCAGVHLGQTDLPPSLARTLAARDEQPLRIGLSVHDATELEAALDEPCDYLALGPVFKTGSKAVAKPALGLEGLDRLLAQARAYFTGPLIAIGGITRERAPSLAGRCDGGAVIAGLLDPPAAAPASSDPYRRAARRARQLHAALSAREVER